MKKRGITSVKLGTPSEMLSSWIEALVPPCKDGVPRDGTISAAYDDRSYVFFRSSYDPCIVFSHPRESGFTRVRREKGATE